MNIITEVKNMDNKSKILLSILCLVLALLIFNTRQNIILKKEVGNNKINKIYHETLDITNELDDLSRDISDTVGYSADAFDYSKRICNRISGC